MFTAASAFALFTSDDIDRFVSSNQNDTNPTAEGYNYYQRVNVDTWPQSEDVRTVSWEVYPMYDWLHYHINGNEIAISGTLPAYDARMSRTRSGDLPYRDSDGNHYTVHVVARLLCDVPAGYDDLGLPLSDDTGKTIIVQRMIAADVDTEDDPDTGTRTSGLVIDVTADDTKGVGLYEDMVSVDASAVASRDAADENYTVTVNFPQNWSTEFMEAVDPDTEDFLWDDTVSVDYYVLGEVECVAAPASLDKHYILAEEDGISLPYWLDYDITEVQQNISRDYPDVTENPPATREALTFTEYTDPRLLAKTLKLYFKKGATPDNGEKGTVRIVMTPSTTAPDAGDDKSQSLDDIYNGDVTLGWGVTYVGEGPTPPTPAITLTPAEKAMSVVRGSSAETEFTYSNAEVSGDPKFSPAVAGVTFSTAPIPANESGKITVTAAATSEAQNGDYPVTMTVTDVNGKTATATINLAVSTQEGTITVAVSGDRNPNEATFTAGGNASSYTLRIGNTLGGITWEITGTGIAMISPTSGTGNAVNFTINPTNANAGRYSATLQAKDASGRDAGSYQFSWTVEAPVVNPIVLSVPNGRRISVDVGSSSDLVVNYSVQAPAANGIKFDPDISENVKLTAKPTTSTSGTITITAEPVTVAAKIYSTDMTVTDTNGKTASVTIYVNVEVPVITLAESRVSLTRASADKSVAWSVVRPRRYSASPAIASGYNFRVTSNDRAITLAMNPDASFTQSYTGTLTVTDIYGGTKAIALTLNAAPVGTLIVTPSTLPVSVDVGASKDVAFTASGNSGAVSWTVGTAPAGVSVVHTANGHFTVTGRAEGRYPVTVTATDQAGRNANASLDITVNPEKKDEPEPTPSRNFTITADTPSVTVAVNQSKDVSFTASNNSGDVTYTFVNGNTGITVVQKSDPSKFTVTGVTLGDYTFRVNATDRAGKTASADVAVKVTATTVPVVPSRDITVTAAESSVRVNAGASVDVSLTAANNAGLVTWSYDVSGTGITVVPAARPSATQYNNVAVYTVTGVTAGSYTVTFKATDAAGRSASADVAITVNAPVPPVDTLTVVPEVTAASVDVGASRDVAVTARGNSGVVAWSYDVSGAGITIVPSTKASATQNNTVAVYTVTGVTAGSYTVTFKATDSAGHRASADVAITVNPVGTLTVTPATRSVDVTIGGSSVNTEAFTASGNIGNVEWTVSGVPSGVTVAPATGTAYTTQNNTVMVYTVTASSSARAGSYSATVTARDSAGRSTTATLRITVTAAPTLAVSPSARSVRVTRGASVNTEAFTASNNSGNVTWTVSNIPSGVTVTPTTQSGISATYTVTASSTATAGEYRATVTAKDEANRTATATLSITVAVSGDVISEDDKPEPPEPEDPTPATQQLIDTLKSEGSLESDGTIPSDAIEFTSTNPSAQTLSRTGTNEVRRGSGINPIDLVLTFEIDIWKIYINNVLAAWAYSPGVNATEDTDFVTFYPAEGSKGVDIVAESKTKATITFDTTTMAAGRNEIAAAFVPDASQPTQEIGKSTLAAVTVDTSTTPTSPDVPSSPDVPGTDPVGVGDSNGGCSAGLGAMVSALAAMFFVSKKRS